METTFNPGDLIRVEFISLGEKKEKATVFEGIVMGIRGREENKSFTVRRIGAGGIGVERIFPMHSPLITKITVKRRGNVRRAKLNYLRKRIGRAALLT
jgi:large subunit ribosomal protein L19